MKTILLADDEEHLRTLVHATLDTSEYRIVEAVDGEDALARALELVPDLMVVDWMMPGMTGLEVTRAVRQNPTTASIPVVLLTARSQESDRLLGLTAGATAFLVKPFSPLQLLDLVDHLMETAR